MRYPSDLTNQERAIVSPLLPAAKRGGRPRTTDLRSVLDAIRYRYPWLRHVFADGGYAGDKFWDAMKGHGDWTVEIINRSDTAKGFGLLPRTLSWLEGKPLPGSAWVVEHPFVWPGRCRRLAKDWEATIESSTAWAYIAKIKVMTRRLATYCNVT